jgi:hypothetical protein
MIPYKLDSGRFPRLKYNRVVARGRRAEQHFRSPAITQGQALGIWKVVQDVNSVEEPTLAIKKRADHDRTRRGFI